MRRRMLCRAKRYGIIIFYASTMCVSRSVHCAVSDARLSLAATNENVFTHLFQ